VLSKALIFAFCSPLCSINPQARMAETIRGRQVYKFRMEPTELEALELERTASVARYIYNWGLARGREYYRQQGKGKPWANYRPSSPSSSRLSC
jgi:hypothetical protein